MQRATPLESHGQSAADRGAQHSAPRSPLTIVSGAVAGDDLHSVARSASEEIGRPVVIAIPSLGEPVVHPAGALAAADIKLIVEHAVALIGDHPGPGTAAVDRARPDAPIAAIADAVPVRIGREVVGIVAAPGGAGGPDDRPWLEGAAAAAAVTALMRDAREGDLRDSRRALLQALGAGPPADLTALLAHARRLGHDLSAGAVALCAQLTPGREPANVDELVSQRRGLLAVVGERRLLGLVPLASPHAPAPTPRAVAAGLEALGMHVALSAPRRDPAALHEALREAELLVELACFTDAALSGQEETYRLLIGVLLRDPEELEQLRARTVSPLADYDAQHDTELVATLQAFLAHHGSTTETAEAMSLHRHTVGYRLSRVHEVSGLSPYESDGRERLSLGLKADQILAADQRRIRHQ
ncbi:MAG: helix-turn-helix domain-containing protein [Solirubrobacteraceae bacterium]|jgi:hypothetical protein